MSYLYESIDNYDELVWDDFQDYVNQLKSDDLLDLDFGMKATLEEDLAFRKEIRVQRIKQEEPNRKSAIDEFIGIIEGINFDGIVNDLEVDTIRQWLERNYILLNNSRYSSFLLAVKEIISDGIVDDQERDYLIGQAYKFKSDINSIDSCLNNLNGILKGITSDNVIVDSEVLALCQWIVDNSQLSGISIYDKLCDVLNNILDDGVITASEMEYLQTYITCELIPDSFGEGKKSNGALGAKSDEYLFKTIKEILEKQDGLRAKKISAQIEGTKPVDINRVLYSKKYKEAFVQDDDFRWHLREIYEKLTDHEIKVLREILTDEIHDLKLVKQLFFKHTDNANTEKINQLNMLELGYQIAGPVLYRSKTQTINEFLRWYLQKDMIVDLTNVESISTLAQAKITFNELKNDFTIVEFDKLKFINIKKLEEGGVTKAKLIDYCYKICEFANKQYFNIKSVYDAGFSHELDGLGFDSFFYESLIKASERCSYFQINGVCVFLEGQTARGLPEILERYVYSHGSTDIYDLIDYLYDKYGIEIGKKKVENNLKKTELYYSETMEKAYRDYDEFFMEV